MEQKQSNLSPVQKQMLFAQMTRQNIQKLPPMALTEGGTVSFDIPKTRLTSKIWLLVKGTFKGIHASNTTFTVARHAPYSLLKNIRVDINNGFMPFNVSGAGAYELCALRKDTNVFTSVNTSGTARAMCKQTNALSSSTGADNTTMFALELPLTLNDRDTAGIILTQNDEVNVKVTIDVDTVLNAIIGNASGVTTGSVNFTLYPLVESFTIPVVGDAIPDISVIKLVQEQKFTIAGSGDTYIKLPVGTTYRRIVLDFYDASGAFSDAEVTEFAIQLNQAENPYLLTSDEVQMINQINYTSSLPAGVFAFDFSSQGLPNYGGSRDYIDTSNLTEFWIKVTTTKAGTVRVVSESLARMKK